LRHKKKEYLRDKINELATNSKNSNITNLYRGITEFNRDSPAFKKLKRWNIQGDNFAFGSTWV
jgi:hypothetical protein